MLFGSRRLSEPAVIGNVDQEIGAFCSKFANLARINSFVTDIYTEFVTARQNSDRRGSSLVKAADFIGDALHYVVNQRKWLVLAERHQVTLVVTKNPLAVWIDKQRAVIGRLAHVTRWRRFRFPFHNAREKGMTSANCQARGACRKLALLPGKRSGCFGPNDQIGLVPSWIDTQLLQFIHIVVVKREPVSGVRVGLRKIRLDSTRKMAVVSFWNKPRSGKTSDQYHCEQSCNQRESLGNANGLGRVSPGEQSVERGNQK